MSELGDLLELLHGVRHRFRSLRATLRHSGDSELSERAWKRYRESGGRGSQMEIAVGRASAGAGPPPVESEPITRLWWVPPDRLREERSWPGHALKVVDGRRSWSFLPGHGVMSSTVDPTVRMSARPHELQLFDPGRFLGTVELEPLGPTRQAGRAALRARARPRAVEGAMDHSSRAAPTSTS